MTSPKRMSWLAVAAVCVILLAVPVVSAGCSFNPAEYFSRNACEVFNCGELFFVEDLFPLSAGPEGGGGMAPEAAAEEEVAH